MRIDKIKILLVFWLFFSFLYFRNIQIFNYRWDLISNARKASVKEIENRKFNHWKERLNIITSVAYEDMLFEFWKPLDSFYPDKKFIEGVK